MHEPPDTTASFLFDFTDQLLGDLEADRLMPLAHYLARFPGHEEHVAREYLALTGTSPASIAQPTTEIRRTDRIGPYRLGAVLGRGGQGVVYSAEDVRLERRVALKVLSMPVASVSQARRGRFRREAEVVSRLDHPGICTVLDADLDGEVPYIAMRFVEGETLATALARVRANRSDGAPAPDESGSSFAREAIAAERRSGIAAEESSTFATRLLLPRQALELSEALSFFERAARALHAAHEAGVVHRDVKPGNIMVSRDGAPVILDFGVARGDEQESFRLTRSGEVFGTPAYISPEQLTSGRNVDRRTDVYSLGVVMFECLTLTRPFQGPSSAALANAIRSQPVPPPRRLNEALPPDLAVVLETALEKDVQRRYPTALELAEELRRVREYEPIRARPAGPWLRLRRWSQRNPVVATATVGSIVALSVALVVALLLLGRVRDETERKQAALKLYEAGWYRDQAAGSLSYSPPRALHFAIAAAQREPGLASNRMLLGALDAMYEKQILVGHSKIVLQLDVDRASQHVLTSSADGTARLWDAQTGAETASFTLGGAEILCARFAPSGGRVVLAAAGGRAAVFDVARPQAAPLELAGHGADVQWAAFSPDGARIVTASRDHMARVFDAWTGALLAQLAGHTGNIAEARFIAGGSRVLTRSAEPPAGATVPESDFTARLFDAATGAELRAFRGHTAAIGSFDVSPDETRLVTTSEDRTARVWRISDGTLEREFDAPGKFHGAVFSPDGHRLALAWDPGAKVVDVDTGEVVYTLPSHEHRAVVRVAFSPDGSELATVAYDDALRVFRASNGKLLRLCRGDTRQINGLRWSPDGSFLATWQRLPTVDLWYGAERPFLQVLLGHTGEVRTARFDRAGERIVTSSADGTARIWNAHNGQPVRSLQSGGPLMSAQFDERGEHILACGEDGSVHVWNAADGTLVTALENPNSTPLPAVFSPDGTRVALAMPAGKVRLIDIATRRARELDAHSGEVSCLRFSPDGSRLATGGDDRCTCLWDATFSEKNAKTDTPLWRSPPFETTLFPLKSVFDVAVSPDGRFVAAGCQNLRIELYDAADGKLCAEATMATPGRVAFSGDGRLLLGTSKYWFWTTLWEVGVTSAGVSLDRVNMPSGPGNHHANSMTSVATASHAPRAVTGSLDHTARLWDLEQRECMASYAGHADSVLDVDISPDGSWIVSASADGTARLWPGDLLGTAERAEPAAFVRSFGPLPTPEAKR